MMAVQILPNCGVVGFAQDCWISEHFGISFYNILQFEIDRRSLPIGVLFLLDHSHKMPWLKDTCTILSIFRAPILNI